MLFRRRLHATNDELNAYLGGALGESVRERIRGHVHACAICQEALEGLRAVQVSLRGLQAKAPRSFALREAAVRPALARPAGGLARATPLLSGVTALALIAFFAVVSFDMSGGGFNASKSARSGVPQSPLDAAGDESMYEPAPGASDTASLGEIERTTDEGQRLTVTASGAAFNDTGAPQAATPEPVVSAPAGEDGDDTVKLRIAEGALAALALASGASALVLVRRRRI